VRGGLCEGFCVQASLYDYRDSSNILSDVVTRAYMLEMRRGSVEEGRGYHINMPE